MQRIIKSTSIEDLECQINRTVKEGWSVVGSPFSHGDYVCILIKKAAKNDKK